MPAPSSLFLKTLAERGFVHQCTDEAALAALSGGPVAAYIGFDCTADSLHVGHLLPIMLLRLFQRCGHRPVALIGGGTTKVGDPVRKDEPSSPGRRADRGATRRASADPSSASSTSATDRRCADARQRGVAGPAALHPVPARRGEAFHRQPHADHGQRAAAAGARAAALLPRIQLHAAPVLRLPGAAPAARLRPADGRLRPVGQHRHRRRPGAADGRARRPSG